MSVLRPLLLAALIGGSALAQDASPPEPAAPEQSTPPVPASETPDPSSERVFRPSEEVSPDQEVDFPADI